MYICVTHQKLKWFGFFFHSVIVASTLGFSFTHCSRGLYALFSMTHQTIQYTHTVYAVTIMRFYNHSTRSLFLSHPPLSRSFYLPLGLFQSHAISVLIIVTHATRNSNTICPIFNSTEVTRFSPLWMIFKKGSSNNERRKKNTIRVPFPQFVIQIFKN